MSDKFPFFGHAYITSVCAKIIGGLGTRFMKIVVSSEEILLAAQNPSLQWSVFLGNGEGTQHSRPQCQKIYHR
jgi:hypothetical protein